MRAALPLLFAAATAAQDVPAEPALAIDRDDDAGRLTVRIGDHEIVAYRYADGLAIPHWFPMRSPSGKDLVIQHPDPFPHHRALWIADKVQLGDGPVIDFYHCFKNQNDADDASRGYRHAIRHRAFGRCEVRDGLATVVTRLQWLAGGETPVLDDERTLTVRPLGDGEALLELSWTLRAAHGPVAFHSDPVHYAWPYLRVHPRFSVEQGGTLVDDEGRSGQKETNGAYARWVDYSNTVGDVTEGVAVFAPADGLRRKWLTRDYGCFGPRRPDPLDGTGFTLAKDEEVHGSCAILVHRGDAEGGRVAERYRQWAERR